MSVPLFSAPFLSTVNLIEVFSNTDSIGQGITGLLGIFSIFAWSVMIGKYFELKRLRQLNQAFEYRLREERKLLDLPEAFRNKRTIPYGDLFSDALDAYWRAAQIGQERGEEKVRSRIEHAENALQRALARQTLRYESSMIFLASIVSGAPFLGLLGTVWGVMVAFAAVATQQSASIQTLAPGVSAALTTTIAGLVVAIPSVFGYNYLLNQAKVMITELENYASSLADRIELETSVSAAPTPTSTRQD
jgi:biopolymer transport protein TolQ